MASAEKADSWGPLITAAWVSSFYQLLPVFKWSNLGGVFQQLGVSWLMYRHPRRAHIILVLARWWPILRELKISLMRLPIGLWALLFLLFLSFMFIFTSMDICGCTCDRFAGGVSWRFQARPIFSWRRWSTALL